ncbi:MAG: hypothetical protein ACE10D_07420 [Planctomycetota bacterium]
MRKILPVLLPLIAAVVVIWHLSTREAGRPDRPEGEETAEKGRELDDGGGFILPPLDPFGTPPETRTPATKFAPLYDLERCIQSGNHESARWHRQKLCERLDEVMADDTLRENLLTLIRTKGLQSTDPDEREVLLAILTRMDDPEATAMVNQAFYGAQSPEERMTMLEAMARPHHDPQQAASLAANIALTHADAEARERAFDIILSHTNDDGLIFETAVEVLEGTTHKRQREMSLMAISATAPQLPAARRWLKERLRRPREEELSFLVEQIDAWGDDRDAAQLEALAEDFPARADELRSQANRLRRWIKQREAQAKGEEFRPDRRQR